LKKYLLAIAIIIVFLVVFIPLASSSPDGLEKVASNFGAKEHQNYWSGLMADYSLPSLGNQYLSTLLSGICGVMVVIMASLLLGKVLFPKSKVENN